MTKANISLQIVEKAELTYDFHTVKGTNKDKYIDGLIESRIRIFGYLKDWNHMLKYFQGNGLQIHTFLKIHILYIIHI